MAEQRIEKKTKQGCIKRVGERWRDLERDSESCRGKEMRRLKKSM